MDRRAFVSLAGFGIAAAAFPADAAAPASIPLAEHAARRGISFGSAVSQRVLGDRSYRQLVDHQCDMLVGENAFKWRHMERRENQREVAEARWIAAYAQNSGKRLRGHCFCWNHHDRMPRWLVDKAAGLAPRDHGELTRQMWRHGAFLARTFPDIACWDAMNEAVDPTTGELRETEFTRLLGEDYVDLSFHIMAERLPSANLVYNETMSWEADPTHRDGVLRVLERALASGVPIHALGIQSHIGKTLGRRRDERAWRRFLEEVEGMGVDVILTEFDCSDRNIAARSREQRDAEVAAHVRAYLDLTLSFTNVRELLVWSLADGPSYMNRRSYPRRRRRADGLPLRGHPFDQQLAAKPMLAAMQGALASAPVR
ncbi:endo-1,4-beta-xylanase [Alteraurantiacibacter aquimixticola]|uniref:Beta-xylanase n=1 Tax=Alteraurantiacibacter aquimixticola TaxID=2489173 RepID=A0A4T3F3G2_9SPHN|nr:endo-1,4-beta-xylanase [Alteraurantiacibacter aquimixticola]TIX50700.1 endo-1,4-beta-xylanase [Alteraurantiacibacter aquimixticola]